MARNKIFGKNGNYRSRFYGGTAESRRQALKELHEQIRAKGGQKKQEKKRATLQQMRNLLKGMHGKARETMEKRIAERRQEIMDDVRQRLQNYPGRQTRLSTPNIPKTGKAAHDLYAQIVDLMGGAFSGEITNFLSNEILEFGYAMLLGGGAFERNAIDDDLLEDIRDFWKQYTREIDDEEPEESDEEYQRRLI